MNRVLEIEFRYLADVTSNDWKHAVDDVPFSVRRRFDRIVIECDGVGLAFNPEVARAFAHRLLRITRNNS